jgi:hypothetical protein
MNPLLSWPRLASSRTRLWLRPALPHWLDESSSPSLTSPTRSVDLRVTRHGVSVRHRSGDLGVSTGAAQDL